MLCRSGPAVVTIVWNTIRSTAFGTPKMRLAFVVATLFAEVLMPHGILAHPAEPGATAAPMPPTLYERFIRFGCVPCVQDAHLVKAVPISAAKLPSLPGVMAGAQLMPRQGEIRFEVMRASELGRETRQLLAVRLTLSAGMGTASGMQFFPLGFGIVDAEDAADLLHAVRQIVNAAKAPQTSSGADMTTIDYYRGSVRVGLVRIGGESIAYLQVGDIPLLAERPVWQIPTTLFIGLSELPALVPVLTDVVTKIRGMRVSRETLQSTDVSVA
jgi:hypothetical protein